MFSEGTYEELDRLTERALKEIQAWQVVDRVTVVRGYQQLIIRGLAPLEYQRRIVTAVQELADFTRQHQKPDLADQLQALASRMDRDRDP
jgi:hypothetical protein